jgi:predicted secreted protein
LGAYLTQLVAAKNERYPEDQALLLYCGILSVVAALRQTTSPSGAIGVRELMQAMTLVMQRCWPPDRVPVG